MKTSSAKSKGRFLQKTVRDLILSLYPELSELDVESTSMGVSGEDVKLSSAALNKFPFAVECKNHARFSVYTHYKQAETHAANLEKKSKTTVKPIVVIKQNRDKPLVLISLEDFSALLKK
jgi:hypothetical protein